MSRRRSARALALTVSVAAALASLAPAARADSPGDVCAAFPHQQTYLGDAGAFQAPAWHYDETVTIVYLASSCTARVIDSGNYVLSIEGAATVFAGEDASGEQLDERPFSSLIRSSAEDDRLGWPIDWWSCFEGTFTYVWKIEGIYTFAMTATEGDWLMVQRDEGSGQALGTAVDGCRKS